MLGSERHDQARLLRAVDAVVSLICAGAFRREVPRTALTRVLAVIMDAGPAGTTDPPTELGRAEAALRDLRLPGACDEPTAREWLVRAHRYGVGLRDAELAESGFEPDDHNGHWCWRLHELDAFCRRLRLLQAALALTDTAVAGRLGIPAGQVRHWRAGNSKPAPAMRERLAETLGVHPAWFAPEREHQADDLYRFTECPCGPGDGFEARYVYGDLDPHRYFDGGPYGIWCAGCGQPYLPAPQGLLYPTPVTEPAKELMPFRAVRHDSSNVGAELAAPWPHALWTASGDPDRAGFYRLPELLAQPPTPLLSTSR